MAGHQHGAKFGVSRQTVSSWENERSLSDLQMLIAICNTYHVSLDKLLNEDKEFVEKIDFYHKYQKAIRFVGMCLAAGVLIFALICTNWKITEKNMNQKELVYGYIVTEHNLKENLQTGVLPVVRYIRKVAGRDKYFVAYFLADLFHARSRCLYRCSKSLKVLFWY